MHKKAYYYFIEKGLRALGHNPTTSLIEFFIFYTQELKRWNKVHNLTSITKDEDIAVKHFFDSLLYLKGIDCPINRLVDIGTGAGFPGIPIKAVKPDIKVTLVEPQRKKCSFLRHLVRQSEILTGCEIINKRVEDIELEEYFDVAVTRALFSINEFAEKSARLIKTDGILIISKGPGVDDELRDILSKAVNNTYFLLVRSKGAFCDRAKYIYTYEVLFLKLPFTDIERRLVVMKKKGHPEMRRF